MDQDTHRLATRAAALLHVSTSAFVADAARQAAEKLLASPDVTLMSGDAFDRMVASLSDPDESPELAALASLPRRMPRH
jgi:uncharacterized protein (DUF1778 family)